MALTKATYSLISGAQINVFDYMSAAQIADVQSRARTVDVTTPIKNAIAAASRQVPGGTDKGAPVNTVYFPAGDYLISDTIELGKDIRLVGAGKNFVSTIVVAAAFTPSVDNAVLSINGANITGGFAFRASVENLCFQYADSATAVDYFAYIDSAYTIEFIECSVYSFLKTAFYVNNANDIYFQRCVIFGYTPGVWSDNTYTDYAVHGLGTSSITLDSCDIEASYVGVYVEEAATVTLNSIYIERCYHPFYNNLNGNGTTDNAGSLTIVGGVIYPETTVSASAGMVNGQNNTMIGTKIDVFDPPATARIRVLGRYNNISFFNVVGVRRLNSGDTYNINVISDEYNYSYKAPTFVSGDREGPDRWWPNVIAISKELTDNTDTAIIDIGLAAFDPVVPRQCVDVTLRLNCIGFSNLIRQVSEFRVSAGFDSLGNITSGFTQVYNSGQGDTGTYTITFTLSLVEDAPNNKVTVNVKAVSTGGASGGATTTLIGELAVLDNTYGINSYVRTR